MCICEKNSYGIKIKGHVGTWYVIDQRDIAGNKEFLLEHETYGEDAAAIIVNEKGEIILEDVFNGFSDLDEVRNNQ